MTVADGSRTRLGDLSEVAIGAIPTTPAWQEMRYVSSDVRLSKQTDIPDEIRGDRNSSSIVDVGRAVEGTIRTLLSHGSYDEWFSRLFCAYWSGGVLKNGRTHLTGALEWTFRQGGSDSFIRAVGCRWDTLDLRFRAKQSVEADWGVKGLGVPVPTTAVIAGASYIEPTTTPVMNSALNVASLDLTGISGLTKIQSLTLNIRNNLYANDAIGQYETYSHGLGRFEVSGSMVVYFESLDMFLAIVNHTDVGIEITCGTGVDEEYVFTLPKVKLMDGGPPVAGNGKAVLLEVPFQAYFDAALGAVISITGGGLPALPAGFAYVTETVLGETYHLTETVGGIEYFKIMESA